MLWCPGRLPKRALGQGCEIDVGSVRFLSTTVASRQVRAPVRSRGCDKGPSFLVLAVQTGCIGVAGRESPGGRRPRGPISSPGGPWYQTGRLLSSPALHKPEYSSRLCALPGGPGSIVVEFDIVEVAERGAQAAIVRGLLPPPSGPSPVPVPHHQHRSSGIATPPIVDPGAPGELGSNGPPASLGGLAQHRCRGLSFTLPCSRRSTIQPTHAARSTVPRPRPPITLFPPPQFLLPPFSQRFSGPAPTVRPLLSALRQACSSSA